MNAWAEHRRAHPIEWTWWKVAIAAASVHLTIMLISSVYPSVLGLLLLAPGILFDEMFDNGRSRGGLTFVNVLWSTLFFTFLVVLFRVRRWPAIALATVAVIGGLAAAVGNMLRAIGGP